MKPEVKKSIKDVGAIIMGMGALFFIIIAIPDKSLFQNIFAYIMVIALIFLTVWFTPLGNPIKRVYRFLKDKFSKPKE